MAKKTRAAKRSRRANAKPVAVPVFEQLDCVYVVAARAYGVVLGVASFYRGEPEYQIHYRTRDGETIEKWHSPADLKAA